MKKFKVMYVQSSICEAEVWAENEEEARTIGESMDGSEFIEDPCSGDWEFFGVMEVKEK